MKQDERTPGPGRLLAVRRSMDRNLLVRDNPSEIVGETYEEEDAALIVKAVNAYTSTEALRSALAEELVWHEAAEKALSKQPPSGDKGWRRAEHQERIEAIRAALSGSPAPSTEVEDIW